MKKVGIIMGSDSDLPIVQKAIDTLKEFGVPYEAHIFSAHRTPAEAADFAGSALENGFGVLIAAAGMAAHLAGAIAAQTVLPVIGIPCKSNTLDGIDALLSTVQMPSGIPVATVAINGGVNAALLAIEVLAVDDCGLLGNLIGTVVCGYGIRYAIPAVGTAAETACNARLTAQIFPQTLIRAVFCGILIYLAVEIYKKHKSIAGIVFCIPVFILSGFEHSIADMFYFAASGIVSFKAFGFIWTVILGNTVGGMLLPLLTGIGGRANAE